MLLTVVLEHTNAVNGANAVNAMIPLNVAIQWAQISEWLSSVSEIRFDMIVINLHLIGVGFSSEKLCTAGEWMIQ
jgi:hypothetical protein